MLNNQQGLTLTELLVVSAIIMILTAVTIPNWGRSGQQLKVGRGSYQLHQDIRSAQELTLANAACEECNCSSEVRRYGLHFSSAQNSYILFQDCNNNGIYDDGEAKQEISLEEDVTITNKKLLVGGSDEDIEPGALNIIFQPPEPTVVINDNRGDPSLRNITRAEITIEVDDFERTILTNTVGLVDIQDNND